MATTLSRANELLRNKDYKAALELYSIALQEHSVMAPYIHFNMMLVEKRMLMESTEEVSRNQVAQTFSCESGEYSILGMHQLNVDPQEQYTWESCGNDPYLILDPKVFFTKPESWYEVKLSIRSKLKTTFTRLYFDTGCFFNETESISLTLRGDRVTSRIFRIEQIPLGFRLDPKEKPGKFSFGVFQINVITPEEARKNMLQELVSNDESLSGVTIDQAWLEIENEAQLQEVEPIKLLLQRYDQALIFRPETVSYHEWIEDVECPGLPTPEDVKSTFEGMSNKLLISIVMPVYNTPEKYLRASIDSVLAQSYPYWELCIADDKSPKTHVRKMLQEYAKRDGRIRVVYREQNGHISRASNSALEIAKGDYVALLDHDDTLPEHALYFMALAIQKNPDVKILYSDEDKIDATGKRFDPHFKSDWNPDLFYSQNYVSHLGVYNRELLNRIGGFRVGLEGSQDQDLLLRCLPLIKPEQIIHIPRVLYHWRAVEGSTARSSEDKSYTSEAGISALRDYFAEHGPEGVSVEAGLVPNTYHVRWPISQPEPLVSLLIPTRDRKTITEVAVRSILDKTTYSNYEIIIIDNGSIEEETLEWFDIIQRENCRVTILRYDYPFNYSAINNYGVKHARGNIIGLINNDVEVISPDWLTEMVSHACREDIGCVGAKLYYSNDTLQHGGIIVSLGGVAGHSHKHRPRDNLGYFNRLVIPQNLSGVTAACLIVRKDIFEAVGGLDEDNLTVAFNDVDFCLKVREAGYRNLWTPYAELYHHESISRGSEDSPEKQVRAKKEIDFMISKWSEALKSDPFYNINLTRDREDFSIGFVNG